MKFRNPKTGEVFEDIEAARVAYCEHIDTEDCGKCPLNSDINGTDGDMCCNEFSEAHPADAARLMGLEVVEEKEEPMEKTDKPRICEALGVEVGERFDIFKQPGSLYIDKDGWMKYDEDDRLSTSAIHIAINHPDRIIRKPRFTREEVEVLRHLSNAGVVSVEKKAGTHLYWDGVDCGGVMVVPPGFLPSLRPGQSVALEDIIGGANHAE